MRKRSSTCDPQRVEGGTADGDGMSSLTVIKPKGSCYACSSGISTLCCVIKAFTAHRRSFRKTALHLVGHGQCSEELFTISPRIFTCGQNGAQIIARMTRLALGEEAIVEIQVANQGAILKCRSIRSCASAANQRGQRRTTEFIEVLTK